MTEWLDLKDVGRLDSAFCSKEATPDFLSLLTHRGNIFKSKLVEENKLLLMFWSAKRGAQLDGFSVSNNLVQDDLLLDRFLIVSGPSIRWIAFNLCWYDYKQQEYDRPLNKIMHCCTHTEELNLNEFSSPVDLCDELFPKLTQAFTKLHTLHMECSGISTNGLKQTLQHCKQLLKLHLSHCESEFEELFVADDGWLTDVDAALAVCGQHCKNLECVTLQDCFSVSAAGIRAIAQPGNKLWKVVLSGCDQLRDEAVLAVVHGCPQLKKCHCPPQVSSEAIAALANGCPLLEVMYLNDTDADDSVLTTLAHHCPLLRKLFVGNCPRITLDAIAALQQQYTVEVLNERAWNSDDEM